MPAEEASNRSASTDHSGSPPPPSTPEKKLWKTFLKKMGISLRILEKEIYRNKLRWFDLRRAEHRLGKKAYESQSSLSGQNRTIDRLSKIQRRIELLGQPINWGTAFKDKARAAVKGVVRAMKIQIFKFRRNRAFRTLGRQLRQTPNIDSSLAAETDYSKTILEKIRRLDSERQELAPRTYIWARRPLWAGTIVLALVIPLAGIAYEQEVGRLAPLISEAASASPEPSSSAETSRAPAQRPSTSVQQVTQDSKSSDNGLRGSLRSVADKLVQDGRLHLSGSVQCFLYDGRGKATEAFTNDDADTLLKIARHKSIFIFMHGLLPKPFGEKPTEQDVRETWNDHLQLLATGGQPCAACLFRSDILAGFGDNQPDLGNFIFALRWLTDQSALFDPERRITLVAHSLGGNHLKYGLLLFQRNNEASGVSKLGAGKTEMRILFLATPHRGTALTIAGAAADFIVSICNVQHFGFLHPQGSLGSIISDFYKTDRSSVESGLRAKLTSTSSVESLPRFEPAAFRGSAQPTFAIFAKPRSNTSLAAERYLRSRLIGGATDLQLVELSDTIAAKFEAANLPEPQRGHCFTGAADNRQLLLYQIDGIAQGDLPPPMVKAAAERLKQEIQDCLPPRVLFNALFADSPSTADEPIKPVPAKPGASTSSYRGVGALMKEELVSFSSAIYDLWGYVKHDGSPLYYWNQVKQFEARVCSPCSLPRQRTRFNEPASLLLVPDDTERFGRFAQDSSARTSDSTYRTAARFGSREEACRRTNRPSERVITFTLRRIGKNIKNVLDREAFCSRSLRCVGCREPFRNSKSTPST
jgi:hypothetical protein